MTGGVLFVAGALGLLLYTLFLMWDVRRTNRLFAGVRKYGDRIVSRGYRMLVFGEVSHEYRFVFGKYARLVIHWFVVLAVGVLRATERPLARMGARLRHSERAGNSEKEPSPFLQTITPEDNEKKKGETKMP